MEHGRLSHARRHEGKANLCLQRAQPGPFVGTTGGGAGRVTVQGRANGASIFTQIPF